MTLASLKQKIILSRKKASSRCILRSLQLKDPKHRLIQHLGFLCRPPFCISCLLRQTGLMTIIFRKTKRNNLPNSFFMILPYCGFDLSIVNHMHNLKQIITYVLLRNNERLNQLHKLSNINSK